MKKIFFALMLCLPMIAMAGNKGQKIDKTPYLEGAVPEVNGTVTFQKSFRVPGKSQAEIYSVMKPFVEQLVNNSVPAPGNYARIVMDSKDTLVAKVCEFQVYKNKFLNLDRSRFRYTLAVIISNERVQMTMTGLNYYYREMENGEGGILYRAEEWINDANALNKSHTKLLPISGKFRIKTVDRANELFESAMDAFEEKFVPKVVEQPKKVRKTVTED